MPSKIKITPEIYANNIPDCCALRTVEEHEEIMWCWGLQSQIECGTATKDQNCGLCEMNTLMSKEEFNIEWKKVLTSLKN
jgi:hypothetical protein